MALLSTGLVIAGAFADKLRKTLFAQLRDMVKSKEIEGTEVARAAGEINRLLYEIIVNELKMDKGDVVRIRVEYEVKDGKIVWKYDTLTLEAFRRVPDAEVQEKVRKVLESGSGQPEHSVVKLGETPLGDVVYAVKEGEREIGKIVATPVDKDVVVRGAFVDPPRVLERTRIVLSGGVDETVAREITRLVQSAKPASEEEAQRIIKEIEELLR